jgi:hypothetical protein
MVIVAPNAKRGKIEISGLMNNKSVGPGATAESATKKEIVPKVKPRIKPDFPFRMYAPISTGICMIVTDTVFNETNPKKGTNPITANIEIKNAYIVMVLIRFRLVIIR